MDEATLAAQRRRHQRELRRLGGILRELRVQARMTQADVAKSLGRSQSFVTKYEAGRRRLDLVELDRVCSVLAVSLEECVRQFAAR